MLVCRVVWPWQAQRLWSMKIRLVLPLKAADPIMPEVVSSVGMCCCLRWMQRAGLQNFQILILWKLLFPTLLMTFCQHGQFNIVFSSKHWLKGVWDANKCIWKDFQTESREQISSPWGCMEVLPPWKALSGLERCNCQHLHFTNAAQTSAV